MVHYNYAGRMINIKEIHQEIFSGSFKFGALLAALLKKGTSAVAFFISSLLKMNRLPLK